jgi:hypothetical protein
VWPVGQAGLQTRLDTFTGTSVEYRNPRAPRRVTPT